MRGLYAIYPPKDHKDFSEERLPPKVSPFEHVPDLDKIRIEQQLAEGRKLEDIYTEGDNMITDEAWDLMFKNLYDTEEHEFKSA